MSRDLKCLRCDRSMEFLGREKLQLGQYGVLLGHIPNLIDGALELDLWSCPECGKVEMFRPEFSKGQATNYTEPGLPQVRCPNCGNQHDFDYPKCPYCGHA